MLVKSSVRKLVCVKRVSVLSTPSVNSLRYSKTPSFLTELGVFLWSAFLEATLRGVASDLEKGPRAFFQFSARPCPSPSALLEPWRFRPTHRFVDARHESPHGPVRISRRIAVAPDHHDFSASSCSWPQAGLYGPSGRGRGLKCSMSVEWVRLGPCSARVVERRMRDASMTLRPLLRATNTYLLEACMTGRKADGRRLNEQ